MHMQVWLNFADSMRNGLPNPAIFVSGFLRLRRFIYSLQTKARSSEGEHFPDTEGVGGSIPPVPTRMSSHYYLSLLPELPHLA
jgi:hypothetical protein